MEFVIYLFGVVSGILGVFIWAASQVSGKASREEEVRDSKKE